MAHSPALNAIHVLHITGTNNLDRISRHIATTVTTMNTGKDARGTICIKKQTGKKFGFSNPSSTPPAPL